MNELATIESALVSIEGEVVTIDVASILSIEIFAGIPLWFILLIVAAFFVLLFLILLISWVFHAEKEVKRIKHHPASSHELMIELQKELLRSIGSTSKQNWLMIWLTVLFISVSVLGGAFVLNIIQNVGDFGATWIAQLIEYINSILTQ